MDAEITACLTAMIAAVQLFGSSYCLAFAAMAADSSAAVVAATMAVAVTMVVAITVVSGSFYCFSSAVMALASETTVAVTTVADAAQPGTTAAEIPVETAVAANPFEKGLGGIFGCPSCHDYNPSLTQTLKLFLPYFPLHIQNLVRMYLNFLEFMHTFEMIQNMMNHMDEYQALFKMFEGLGGTSVPPSPDQHSSGLNPLENLSSLFSGNGFSMPDLSSMKKMMEGSDLVDEFTYVEEPSGSGWNGS